MAALPEAKNADFVATYNIGRMLGMGQAMVPKPLPAESFASKSNMIVAFSMGKGKAGFRMALPKEHLTEIMRAALPLAGK
ncbi:MAG TPA: hypothetical protein VLJ16_08355 [Acidobacteriota bacterium]|nr:hypothetical protein [Acidobacteriota bacterium]